MTRGQRADWIPEAIRLRDKGMIYQWIAQRLGVSGERVRQVLDRHNREEWERRRVSDVWLSRVEREVEMVHNRRLRPPRPKPRRIDQAIERACATTEAL